VVDANGRRVITRALGDDDVQKIANDLTPRGRSAFWNQAMIDLGALVCTARKPSCSVCPLGRWCTWTPSRGGRPRSERPFRETSRFVRGRIVSELRSGPSGIGALQRRVGVEAQRFDAALESLQRDGLVSRRGRRVSLG
jgi:A/G-specific adenine glycosylase